MTTNYLQVLPLPNKSKLTDTITDVSNIIYDNSNPNYTPNGKYIATSSSYANFNNKAYNIFNGINSRYFSQSWSSDYAGNPNHTKKDKNTYPYPEYSTAPYTGEVPSTYCGGGNIKTKYETNIGSTNNTTTHYGEWVQIQLPYKIYLYRYSLLTPKLPSGINSFPKKFIITGSNDGKKWELVHVRDYKENNIPIIKDDKPILYNLNSTENYSYFRLIITEVADKQTIAAITQWNIDGNVILTKNTDAFSNIQENFNGLEKFTSIPYYEINGPYNNKYISDTCKANDGNYIFTDYATSAEALKRSYPACKGISKEVIKELVPRPPIYATMNMPGLITMDDISRRGALTLDGTSNQYVTLPPIKTTNTGLTFSLWFKSNNSGTWARLFDIGNGAGRDNILLAINNNKLIAWTPNGSKWVNNKNINDNVWHHVAWTISSGDDLSQGIWKFYLDGNLLSSSSGVVPKAVMRTKSYIGKSNWGNDPYFNGKISEFRIYHKELSNADISYLFKLFNSSDNSNDAKYDPYLYYSFDSSTVINGITIANVNSNSIIEKSIQYTLRGSDNLMDFSKMEDNKNNVGKPWVDSVTSWNIKQVEPFTEGATFATVADVSNTQIPEARRLNTDYNAMLTRINTRYYDISSNVNAITNTQGTGYRDVMLNNDMYDYSGDLLNVVNKKPEYRDAVKEDSVMLLSQQNSIFILGTICSTALLILAISLAS